MNPFKTGFTGIVLLMLAIPQFLFSQQNISLGENEKKAIIEKAIGLLYENYIYPERVSHLEKYLSEKIKTGGYSSFTKPGDFLTALNDDMERECKDHHVDIFFDPERVRQIRLERQNDQLNKPETYTSEFMQRMQYENFRLRKTERLDGNIGYLKFLNFAPLAPAKESIAAAMNFLHYSSAIIIDLRENRGGYAETVGFMLSYFLKDSLQTGETRYRKENKIIKNYVSYDAMIKKIPGEVPVFILVSNQTSSAAEAFTYTLQQFKRAVVVGEQTKGEGNAGELFDINEMLYIMIPTTEGRSIISGKGIDGIGVTPDIKINADKAYSKALLELCKQLSVSAGIKDLKQVYDWQIPVWENEISPSSVPTWMKNNISGSFKESRKIVFENDCFYYISGSNQKTKLTYLGKNIFNMEGKPFTRIRIPESTTRIDFFEFVWDDGFIEKIIRVD